MRKEAINVTKKTPFFLNLNKNCLVLTVSKNHIHCCNTVVNSAKSWSTYSQEAQTYTHIYKSTSKSSVSFPHHLGSIFDQTDG